MLTYEIMRPAQRRAGVELAAQAFADYEYFAAFIPNDAKRAACLRHMLGANMRAYGGDAVLLAASEGGQLVAVAQLKPPHTPDPSAARYLLAGGWQAVLHGGPRSLRAWFEMERQAEKPCRQLPGQAWFISVLVVSPEREGQGIGSRMLRQCVIPYVRRQGGDTLCLFTNAERNCRFYQKNGFEQFDFQQFYGGQYPVSSWSYRLAL